MKYAWLVFLAVSCGAPQKGGSLYETREQRGERERQEELAGKLERAEHLYREGDEDSAAILYRELAVDTPGDAVPRARLATIHHRRHEDAEAERWLRETLALEPGMLDARYKLVSSLLRQDRPQDAAAEFQALHDYGPGDEKAELRLRGALAVRLGQLDEAARFFEELLRIDQDSAAAYVGLGVIKALAGDLAGALTSLDHAVDLAPGSPVAYYNRALVHYANDNSTGAAADGRKAVELDPWFMAARNNLAATLVKRGDLPAASKLLEETIALRPAYAPAHANLGVVLMTSGDLEGAESALERAIERSPRIAAFHFNLGVVHFKRGDLTTARQDFIRVLELDPQNADARKNIRFIEGREAGTLMGTQLPVTASRYTVGDYEGESS